MITNTNLTRQNVIDLSDVFAVSNVLHTPLLSILLQKNKDTKATDVVVSRKIKTLNVDFSGAKAEGAKVTDFQSTGYTYVTNVCEIFSKAVSVSGTTLAINGDGKTLLAKELQDRLDEIKGDIEKQLINGVKDDGSTSGTRKMDGLVKLSGKAVDVKGVKLDMSTLNVVFKDMFNNKATKDVYMFVSPEDKILIDSLVLNKEAHTVNIGAGATTVGVNVERFWTSYGFMVNIVVEPSLAQGNMLVADLDKVELPILRSVGMEDLAKVGDSVEAFVVVELTVIASKNHVFTVKNFLNA